MIISYFVTEMIIANSVISQLMPKNSADAYIDIIPEWYPKGASMNSRLISIIRKEFIQIFRDPRTLVLIIVMPMLQLFLLGYAATTDVKNISLAVWDQSHSQPVARPAGCLPCGKLFQH